MLNKEDLEFIHSVKKEDGDFEVAVVDGVHYLFDGDSDQPCAVGSSYSDMWRTATHHFMNEAGGLNDELVELKDGMRDHFNRFKQAEERVRRYNMVDPDGNRIPSLCARCHMHPEVHRPGERELDDVGYYMCPQCGREAPYDDGDPGIWCEYNESAGDHDLVKIGQSFGLLKTPEYGEQS